MTSNEGFTLTIGGLEKDAVHMIKNADGPLSPDAIGTSSVLSIAISLKRIADAMEKQQSTLPDKPPSHPPFGISTAVRRPADDPPPRKPTASQSQQSGLPNDGFWSRAWHSILHPSTDWIQEDGSHSW